MIPVCTGGGGLCSQSDPYVCGDGGIIASPAYVGVVHKSGHLPFSRYGSVHSTLYGCILESIW